MVTNGFAPEFGRATGGLINVVTKSGTNELHGEAHNYYRGSRFTENDAIGEPPNITTQNQFGGSVGFPIHKDRQFLFLAADTQLQNGPLVTQFCAPGAGQAACLAALASTTGPRSRTARQEPAPRARSLCPAIFRPARLLPSGCGTPGGRGPRAEGLLWRYLAGRFPRAAQSVPKFVHDPGTLRLSVQSRQPFQHPELLHAEPHQWF